MKNKEFGHRATAAYCNGYTDENGHWNTGFMCPVWAEQDKNYCCGPSTHKYCCMESLQQMDTNTQTYAQSHIPLVVGVAVSLSIVCLVTSLLLCIFCKGCLLYKKRKQRRYEDFDGMSGEEMRKYFSNEFVLIPGRGTFCPDILDESSNCSDKSLCPRELHLLTEDSCNCNINQAYSSSNISSVTVRDVAAAAAARALVTSSAELSDASSRCSINNMKLDHRDSGCYTTGADNDLAGVSSLFATIERPVRPRTVTRRESLEQTVRSCRTDSCSVLYECNAISSDEAKDGEETEPTPALTHVQCCQRNHDPHMHSKV